MNEKSLEETVLEEGKKFFEEGHPDYRITAFNGTYFEIVHSDVLNEFNKAIAEYTEYFDNGEFYTELNLPVPSWEERFNKMRKTMTESYGPGLITFEEKTNAMRKEVAAWKRLRSLPKEEAEKELGYKIVGNWGS